MRIGVEKFLRFAVIRLPKYLLINLGNIESVNFAC